MLKALIVEDDKFLASSLKAAIADKFDVDVSYNGLDGQKLIDNNIYDFFRLYRNEKYETGTTTGFQFSICCCTN